MREGQQSFDGLALERLSTHDPLACENLFHLFSALNSPAHKKKWVQKCLADRIISARRHGDRNLTSTLSA
jgi:hypothetical protein